MEYKITLTCKNIMMGTIENKEINELEFIKQKIISSLTKEGKISLYKKIIIGKIQNNIYYVKSQTGNISLFVNEKGEYLLGTADIIKHMGEKKYNEYLKKLGYKEIKDQNGYYHMIEIKTGKEIPQESLRYYEIFETLGNIQYRDYLSEVIYQKGLKEEGEKLKKMPNLREQMDEVIFPELENMTRFYVLKPIELLLFKQYGIIEDEHFNKLKKKVYSFDYIKKLIKNNVWDYVKGKDKEMKINGKAYKLNTNQITEDELKLYLDLKIINKEEYELLKDIFKKRKLEQKNKEHMKKIKKEFSELKGEIEK